VHANINVTASFAINVASCTLSGFSQPIDTESDGGNRERVVERLRDNPR
jgi:hypothetical protein